ncbi:MAG: Gfo/Idh/MocA family protein [Beijerinckiaceae bacterium]
MADRLRVACVGTGFFSRFQYRAWKRLKAVDLVALCNRTRESGENFAREFDVPAVYTDIGTMLAESRPHLLDIITPPETHLAAIRAAAAAGVDVICQKPFCQNLPEAREAVAIAEAAGISIVIHENFRFQPWYPVLKTMLEQGLLGQVYQATFRLRPGDGQGPQAYLDRQPYFQTMPQLLIHETAIHLVDVFRYLFGDVATVIAALRRLNPVIAGEDSGLFILDMSGGVRCVFDGNRLSDHPARNRRLTMGELLIEGEKGVISLDGDGGIQHRRHGDNASVDVPYLWHDTDFGGDCVFALQNHVVESRLSGKPLQNTGRDYLANIEVEEAIYAADATGARVSLR